MDATFANLQKDGHNTVDHLVKWMKDAKILDQAKSTEAEVRKMLEAVSSEGKVSVESFKEVLGKMAASGNKNINDLNSSLASAGQKLAEAVSEAARAATNALSGAMK